MQYTKDIFQCNSILGSNGLFVRFNLFGLCLWSELFKRENCYIKLIHIVFFAKAWLKQERNSGV